MNVNFQALADLIKTMDQHPIGSAMFVALAMIGAIVSVAYFITR